MQPTNFSTNARIPDGTVTFLAEIPIMRILAAGPNSRAHPALFATADSNHVREQQEKIHYIARKR